MDLRKHSKSITETKISGRFPAGGQKGEGSANNNVLAQKTPEWRKNEFTGNRNKKMQQIYRTVQQRRTLLFLIRDDKRNGKGKREQRRKA